MSKTDAFFALHQAGNPLVLYNIWDAGSARAVAEAGAKALATGSWSVAAAAGYDDGEALPLEMLLAIVRRIIATSDLPLTVDFEGGYAEAPEEVAANVALLMKTGAVGLNFEDRIVKGKGVHAVEVQAARIAAIRAMAEAKGQRLFINARTDLFLQAPRESHMALIPEAIARAKAYAEAGASGFFAPNLVNIEAIKQLCAATKLPVNIMMMADTPAREVLAGAGVARISHGPAPYRALMQVLGAKAREAMGL